MNSECIQTKKKWIPDPSGCVARRSLTALEDRSSIPDAGNNNVLVTKSDSPTLVGSVCYASLVSASAYRAYKPGSKCWGNNTVRPQQADSHNKGINYILIHPHDGSTYPNMNEEWRLRWMCLLTYRCNFRWARSLYTLHISSLLTQQDNISLFHHKGLKWKDWSVCVDWSVLPLVPLFDYK